MGVIHKTAIVPYRAGQMYTLVNDVGAYPAFMPWCSRVVLHEQAAERLIATLALGLGKIKQQVTTENTMQPGRRIDIRLLDGSVCLTGRSVLCKGVGRLMAWKIHTVG